jgi:predicted RNase H-like HicB family nuclease
MNSEDRREVAFVHLDRLFLRMLSKGRTFTLVIENGEDGCFTASVVELQGCHTVAKTLKELGRLVKEAIEVSLEARGKRHGVPEVLAVMEIHVRAKSGERNFIPPRARTPSKL